MEAKKLNTFSSALDKLHVLTYLAITRQLRFQEKKSIKPLRVIVPTGVSTHPRTSLAAERFASQPPAILSTNQQTAFQVSV